MVEHRQAVFITYGWSAEIQQIVSRLDRELQERGISLMGVKRNLGAQDSIRELLERLQRGNCLILLIDDKYLRSPSCMNELVEIAREKQVYDRVFPLVLNEANIFDPLKRLKYVKHWELQQSHLVETLDTISSTNLPELRKDIDLYGRFRDLANELPNMLNEMNALAPELHGDSDFRYLYHAIERQMKGHPTQDQDKYVFISYSREDMEIMKQIVSHLRGKGIPVWVDDEKLVPGTPAWEREVEQAILGAFAVVVVLSPTAKESTWVLREITLAELSKKRLFPVLAVGDRKASTPFRLISSQAVDIRKDNVELESLSSALVLYSSELDRS